MKILVKHDPRLHWLLHWSPNGHKWYPINEKHICRLPPYKSVRKGLNQVFQGETVIFDGVYVKTLKILALAKA